MGAGAVLTEGSTLDPILQISIPVGGPLASVRPEAVALLCLLQQIREKMDVPGRLTVLRYSSTVCACFSSCQNGGERITGLDLKKLSTLMFYFLCLRPCAHGRERLCFLK